MLKQVLSLDQFEQAMSEQIDKFITVSHYGSFDHSNIYEKFFLGYDNLEYRFKDLIFDNPDSEMSANILPKRNIKEITYLWFSNQVEIILADGNKLLIDLDKELEI